MQRNFSKSWSTILQPEFEKTYFKELSTSIKEEYHQTKCYPEKEAIFSAFDFCSYEDLKVVIIGQDPYHNEGEANGLCFSVKEGIKHPPSLRNIFKELQTDVGKEIPASGDLSHWSKQGVLLLNTVLTVRKNEPGSHQKKGWETFTDAVIKQISDNKEHVVFLLWGKFAESKKELINLEKHTVFTAPHPSPLGAWRGWFGSKHFSKTNKILQKLEVPMIKW